ncbi:aldo/keto reductase [Terracidiphilus gabretensis]|jgi:aryl-alcohol dehydrogenase-like predicted oxidoreductase|uniref:aldo/keto reductase n=1 Tax=Terracidiphilus gabretensis TaxID=1577687 RepID=UPI00071B741B|nr:aldo/keto reductase [Terracidiphilus gabretensis]
MTTTSSPALRNQLRTLGNSDLHLTPIGFGAWAIGGGNWDYGWGPQDDSESIEAIHRALDLGVNWIDTAAIYGLGHSEEVVARALKTTSHKPYVFTKCSMRWDADRSIYRSLKADSLAEEIEGSLRRLAVETIDLYQIHWPMPEAEIEEGWEALARFQKQGKLRWIGVSNFNVAQMKRAQQIAPITSLQPPYSMLRRAIEEEILPFTQANNIGVINYSPMVSGLLTGKMSAERVAAMPADDWRRKAVEFNEPRLSRNLRLVELLREIGASRSVKASIEPGVVAVAWTLRNPAITAAIVGGRSATQVDGLAPALEFRLSDEEYARINSFLAENPV